jgi:hypothetical protein
LIAVIVDYTPNLSQFQAVEPAATLEPNRIEPELCDPIVPLDMDMTGLIAITGIKKESIWSRSHYSWHLSPLLFSGSTANVRDNQRTAIALQVTPAIRGPVYAVDNMDY